MGNILTGLIFNILQSWKLEDTCGYWRETNITLFIKKHPNNNMDKYRLVNQLQYQEKIRVSLTETLFHACEGECDREKSA